MFEGNRNRVLEMLVSNEPMGTVLDAIARLLHDQVPEALCIILVKSNQLQRSVVKENRKQASEFNVGAAPGVPDEWLTAIGHPRAVPFEVWKQHCEFEDPQREPAWSVFVARLNGASSSQAAPAGSIPAMIRSAPIGDSDGSLGAILMVYPEPGGAEPRNQILRASARLAQIAIEHRRFCDDLDFQAHHDSLTGLPNRILLEQRLEDAIVQSRSRGHRLALLYVDVDAFNQINDRFSHRVGDEFLAEIGRRMKGALRPGDMVARIGGDEFNALLPDVGDSAAASALAHRMLEAVRQPVSVDGHELFATASVGVAMFPDDGEEAVDLGRQADAAMYYAKSLGKNRIQTFADKGDVLDDVRMEQDLRHALQEDWLTVYYQPKFSADGQLAGMEALLRMNHPRHGQILPGQFIPIAEKTELIIPIGAWVIMEVCRQIADWRRRELAPVVVAVNVSAVQVARADFAKSVENCLAAHSVPPCLLELEVTESMVIDRESEAYRQMQLLRNQGVFISIDDFGTGFSSLSYLHRLQIDAVKLDRSFVQSIDTDEAAQRLVRAMIGVAQGLGLEVIAEGVETEEPRLQLVAVGCPVMQGDFFSRPPRPARNSGRSAGRHNSCG